MLVMGKYESRPIHIIEAAVSLLRLSDEVREGADLGFEMELVRGLGSFGPELQLLF